MCIRDRGMSVMSEPIVKLLYSASYWEVSIPTLRVLAISIFFVSFVSLTSVFLQSVGRVKTALMTMGVGAVMKLTVNIIMVRNIGIMGAPIGTFACYTSITPVSYTHLNGNVGPPLIHQIPGDHNQIRPKLRNPAQQAAVSPAVLLIMQIRKQQNPKIPLRKRRLQPVAAHHKAIII